MTAAHTDNTVETITVDSWRDFEKIADLHDGWAFRGQRQANWLLWSSISRHLRQFCPDSSLWPEREARAIRIFQRKAHNFLSDSRVLDDPLRCLALMQHHGAPTRLLDFTKSAYVAAFFAMSEAVEDAAVYAVNTPMLWHATPKCHRFLSRQEIDPRNDDNFEKFFVHNEYPVVWTGEPGKLDPRLLAQSGTFVIPGCLDRSVDELLHEQYESSGEPVLLKWILPASLREDAMKNLYRMNITYATIFQDLNGLAKSSAFELEMMWKGVVGYPKHLVD